MKVISPLLPYFGGKSNAPGSHSAGKWITSVLPTDARLYCEPFGGLLGILLARPPAQTEIVNDLNDMVYDLWRAIQRHPDELAHLLANTPNSRAMFEDALEIRDNRESHELVWRGWATAVLISCSMMKIVDCHRNQFTLSKHKTSGRAGTKLSNRSVSVRQISERMANVQLEKCDAVRLIEKVADVKDGLIYVDPPYRSTEHSNLYGHNPDFAALLDVLKTVKGRVALSGYPGEWEELDWYRYEKQVYRSVGGNANVDEEIPTRTEILWCNFELDIEGSQRGLFQ